MSGTKQFGFVVASLALAVGLLSGCDPGTGGMNGSDAGTNPAPACGATTCHAGQVCCDSRCGLCASDALACSRLSCPPVTDAGVPVDSGTPADSGTTTDAGSTDSGVVRCGTAVCGPGTYCCNALSNRCTTIGNFCGA